jgi:pimeloyl-ACP methyl ester carboxylesterase
MPFVSIPDSPLLPGRSPVTVYYRDLGEGAPIVILHGGWGYEFYPYTDAIAELPNRFVIPDRTGYGKSSHIDALQPTFHAAAAVETEAVLDALGLSRCVLWGHSDGAIIAAILALRRPARYRGIILEALHLDRQKPRSREFFRGMAENPDALGEGVTSKLAAAHGAGYWRTLIRAGGKAWLDIAATPKDDFFQQRLGELAVPTLVLHGRDDPRTEPGELDRIRPLARIEVIEGAGHSPHSERASAARCTAIVRDFLASLPGE